MNSWINPNDKTQPQYLPHIGEPCLFSHDGKVYFGHYTGGSFRTGRGVTAKTFGTWDCLWMSMPEAPKPERSADESVRQSWARFCHELHRSPDAPYPGMSEAFERHFSQSFIDRDWRRESQVWAAAWKSATSAERDRICAAIKAEDDYCCDAAGYMLDSDDCIAVARGEWRRPEFSAAPKQEGE